MERNRQWIFKSRPSGTLSGRELALEESDIPTAGKGQIVVRTQYLSLDPANRLWMNEDPVYMPPMALNVPMQGLITGVVVDSGSEKFKAGDRVFGLGTWSDYSRAGAALFELAPTLPGISAKDTFGIFYIAAPTAYFGVREICKPKPGETMVVSGAAGAVGSIAGQLGKAWGCRVIGIAGGREKCELLTGAYGMDAAIDYKNEDIGARLSALCPQGIDSFFDNVGGEALDAVLVRMNNFGRIAQCGAVSAYNDGAKSAGPANYAQIVYRRLTVQGFIVFDYRERYPEAYAELTRLHDAGKLAWRLHEEQGLENAFSVLRKLYSGENFGKLMLKVSD